MNKSVLWVAGSTVFVVGIFVFFEAFARQEVPFDASLLGLAIALFALGLMFLDRAKTGA